MLSKASNGVGKKKDEKGFFFFIPWAGILGILLFCLEHKKYVIVDLWLNMG